MISLRFFIHFRLNHSLVRGKSGIIEIKTGSAPGIAKAKSGNLLVVNLMVLFLFYVEMRFNRFIFLADRRTIGTNKNHHESTITVIF